MAAPSAGAPDITHHNLTVPFLLTGTALALILTFRTNSAVSGLVALMFCEQGGGTGGL